MRTRRGAVVRGDSPDRLSAAGWSALEAHGIRTIVDLRNDDEREVGARPPGIDTLHLPLDGEDARFWDRWATGPQFGTPLYYGPHLERFPERSARVIAAIASAPPGGVYVHCVGGRDRTGQVAMLLLALAGVAPEEIAADYALSAEGCWRATPRSARKTRAALTEYLRAGTTAREPSADAGRRRRGGAPARRRHDGRRPRRAAGASARTLGLGRRAAPAAPRSPPAHAHLQVRERPAQRPAEQAGVRHRALRA